MVKPITPSEVKIVIPDAVIIAVNRLIQDKWDGTKAIIKQDEIMELISSDREDDPRPKRSEVYKHHWLDFEDLYRQAGWSVEYDKPGYNEDYDAYFKFERKKI